MSFDREVSSLPSDILKLHKMLTQSRGDQNENLYRMVFAYNKSRIYENFQQSLGFRTLEEYLDHYDLPEGRTLDDITIVVNFFDKATFILLGYKVLRRMMRFVEEYQKNVDLQKRDLYLPPETGQHAKILL